MVKSAGEKTDDTGLTDEVVVEKNGEVIQGEYTLPKIPEKPAHSSDKDKDAWVDYAVSLGLDPAAAKEWDVKDLVKWCG
jgi:hypothetical protein